MGGRAAVLAANHLPGLAAIVIMSCPTDVESKQDERSSPAMKHLLNGGSIKSYPMDGVLPWLSGAQAFASRLWMYWRGYRLRIDWQKFVMSMKEHKVSAALAKLNCPKLFVHSCGDKYILCQSVVELYEIAAKPKELILSDNGTHSTSLMRGDLRLKWTDWIVTLLTNSQPPVIVNTNRKM